jgi:hypothetical protein
MERAYHLVIDEMNVAYELPRFFLLLGRVSGFSYIFSRIEMINRLSSVITIDFWERSVYS